MPARQIADEEQDCSVQISDDNAAANVDGLSSFRVSLQRLAEANG
jgi:hypothetical protein